MTFFSALLIALAAADPITPVTTTRPIQEIALSPDGKRLAWVGPASATDPRPDGVLVTAVDRSGPPRRIATWPDAQVHDLAWSPDGNRLAFVATRAGGLPGLFVVSLGGGAARRLSSPKAAAAAPAWAPDGNRLAFLFIESRARRRGPSRPPPVIPA